MPDADKDRIRALRDQKNEPGGSATKRASEVNVSQLNDMEKRIISAVAKQVCRRLTTMRGLVGNNLDVVAPWSRRHQLALAIFAVPNLESGGVQNYRTSIH